MSNEQEKTMQEPLSDDVVRLIIAARIVAYGGYAPPGDEDMTELDKAVEAFAARVPWDEDPANEEIDAEVPA